MNKDLCVFVVESQRDDEHTMVCAACGRTVVVRGGARKKIFAKCRGDAGAARGKHSIRRTACLAGTALKSLLASIGITSIPNCSCNARAREMDTRGCDWCEENIDTIVGWLREEAANRGLPFLDAAGRLLVRRAIHNARRAAAN